jgi:Tfp pilus assembly protein PilV
MRFSQAGFALPTILISSVIMFIVLVSAVSATANVSASLDRQLYRQLAREAAESGVVRALNCLKNNNYVAQWTSSSSLYPGSPCTGSASTCVAAESCLLLQTSSTRSARYRTYFQVLRPSTARVFEGNSQYVTSYGNVQLLRPDNSVYDTITLTASFRTTGENGVDNIDAIIIGE